MNILLLTDKSKKTLIKVSTRKQTIIAKYAKKN